MRLQVRFPEMVNLAVKTEEMDFQSRNQCCSSRGWTRSQTHPKGRPDHSLVERGPDHSQTSSHCPEQ